MTLLHPRLAFPAVCALLAVGVPFALLGGGDRPPRSAAIRVAPPPAALAPVPPGSLSFALAAPPFDPDRTPGDPPASAEAAAPAEAPAPPPPPVPRLVGIAAGGGGRAVALARGANGETAVLTRGQSLDGWQLVSIGRQDAVFRLGGDRRTVRLDFGNRPAASAHPAVPPVAPPLPSPEIPPPPPAREP